MADDEFTTDLQDEPDVESLAVNVTYRLLDPTYSVLYSPLSDVYIYAVTGLLLATAAVVGLILVAPHGTPERAAKALAAMGWLGQVILSAIVLAGCAYPAYRAWQAARNSPAGGQSRYLFSKDGIDVEGRDGSSLLAWGDISRAVETRKGFLLYRGGRVAAFLPNHSFPSNSEIAIVRKFLHKYVANAALLE
jgi:hypothetical protein